MKTEKTDIWRNNEKIQKKIMKQESYYLDRSMIKIPKEYDTLYNRRDYKEQLNFKKQNE